MGAYNRNLLSLPSTYPGEFACIDIIKLVYGHIYPGVGAYLGHYSILHLSITSRMKIAPKT